MYNFLILKRPNMFLKIHKIRQDSINLEKNKITQNGARNEAYKKCVRQSLIHLPQVQFYKQG